jgi:hypothetical protein
VVPAAPSCTVHDPGIARIHRTVPALSQRTRWQLNDDQSAAMPGVTAATNKVAANDSQRAHVSRPRVTFTPRAFPAGIPAAASR